MKREDLLGLRTIDTLTVGDISLRVRRWSGRSRLLFDSKAAEQQRTGGGDVSPLLSLVFALSVVNDDGTPMFDPSECSVIDDSIPGEVLLAVWDWACGANGLLKGGREDAQKN